MQVGEKNFDFKKDYLFEVYIFSIVIMYLQLYLLCIVFELWIYLQQSFGGRKDHKLAMFDKKRMVTTLKDEA